MKFLLSLQEQWFEIETDYVEEFFVNGQVSASLITNATNCTVTGCYGIRSRSLDDVLDIHFALESCLIGKFTASGMCTHFKGDTWRHNWIHEQSSYVVMQLNCIHAEFASRTLVYAVTECIEIASCCPGDSFLFFNTCPSYSLIITLLCMHVYTAFSWSLGSLWLHDLTIAPSLDL